MTTEFGTRVCPNCVGYCDTCRGPICPDSIHALTHCACCYVEQVWVTTYLCEHCAPYGHGEICDMCKFTCCRDSPWPRRRHGNHIILPGTVRAGGLMWTGSVCNEEIEVADDYKKNKALKWWKLWSDARSFAPGGKGYNKTKERALNYMKE